MGPKPPSLRRLAENQVVFRNANEKAQKEIEKLKERAKDEGEELLMEYDIPLSFYCECSDENCRKRIILKPGRYKKIHENRSQFIITPGHEIPSVERVVLSRLKYSIVEKHKTPPETVRRLNKTNLDHS